MEQSGIAPVKPPPEGRKLFGECWQLVARWHLCKLMYEWATQKNRRECRRF